MKYIDLKIPEHSYFFGFAQTDGTLKKSSRNRGRLEIELGKRDKSILEVFKRLFPQVYSAIRIRDRDTNFKKGYRSYTLTICDMEFRNELNRLGLPYGRKSKIISPPKSEFCERDYVRGLIDGDGSLGVTGLGFPFISFTVKSEKLKKYFLGVVEKITGEKKKLKRNKRDNIYNIMINRERAQKLIDYLYYPNCLALDRKLKKTKIALQWKRPKGLKRIFQKFWEEWEDEYILNHTLEKSCEFLKRTDNSVGTRLWRLKNNKIFL